MGYIHELAGWPKLTWDIQILAEPLAEIRYKQGRHLGQMEAMGFDLRIEANLIALTDEVVKSSAIEGEKLDTEEVRSSIARHLGLDVAGLPSSGRNIDGIVEVMLDATRNFDKPLTTDRLFNWHAAMFPTGRSGILPIDVGQWRLDKEGPMRVVSGPAGRETIHFEAPEAQRIETEIMQFLDWYNNCETIDPVLKAGVAHFWFVTIHPFDDGNGRIARTIADMALAKADGTSERFYSMSTEIEIERKEYYDQLEAAQHGSLDITTWLSWFINCMGRSIDATNVMLKSVMGKAQLWQWINEKPVNERQRLIINKMLEKDWKGFMNTSKYAKINKCSTDTALRDITELLNRGIFLKNEGGGRSTNYRLADVIES